MALFNRNKPDAPARTVNLVKDPAGAPAVNLSKLRDGGHLDLAKRADKAGIALAKRNLSGIRAQAVLVLDHSGSMYADYANGKVQTLVERVLGFALQIDVDGSVPVMPFDSRALPSVDVGVDTYQGVVNRAIWKPTNMGSTNLADALTEVRAMAAATDAPIFCVVVTDGDPNSRDDTTRVVCDLARYPVFLKFVAIRDVPYLQQLDDLPAGRRLLDNVDTKVFTDPAAVKDLEFADALADEWDTWVVAATKAGVLA